MISEIEQVLQLVVAAVIFALGAWAYIDWKHNKVMLKEMKDKEFEKEVSDENIKIHEKYNSMPLDDLLDNSDKLYSKLRSKKDN